MKTIIMSVVTALAMVALVNATARAEVCPAPPDSPLAVPGQPSPTCTQQQADPVPQPILTDDGILTGTLPFVLVDGCGGAASDADFNGQARVVNICDRAEIYLVDDDDARPYYYTYPYAYPYSYPYAYPYSYPYAYPYPYYYGYGWGGWGGWGGLGWGGWGWGWHGHHDGDDFHGHGFHGGGGGFHGGGGGFHGGGGGMGGHGGGGGGHR